MNNLRAILLMIAAMAVFAVSDVFVKLASRSINPAEMLFVMGVIGTFIFAVMTRASGQKIFSPNLLNRVVLFRNVAEVFGTVCMLSALSLAPLSLVAAILQATSLGVTLAGALFLGEKVGPRRWGAIFVGLCGVLLILRPGVVDISLGALLALGAVIGLTARDASTRAVPSGISTLQLATWGFGVLIPTGLIFVPALGHQPDPAPWDLLWLGLATIGAATAYYAVTAAMRLGEVSVVTPFRYSRILFALVLAVIFLGERPDAWTLLGALIVISSGLFVIARERQLNRRAQRA